MEDRTIEELLKMINAAGEPANVPARLPREISDDTMNQNLQADSDGSVYPIDSNDPATSVDLAKVTAAVTQLIRALGEDPTREGLAETPRRAAKMFMEMFAGVALSNDDIVAKHNKTFDDPGTEMVLVKDIGCFSFCEHHFALMYNMRAHIAYIPRGRVVGLSKVARIVDLVCKRFQLQERIGADVAYVLERILGTEDIMVVIEGEHSCMTARGIRAQGAKTRTNTARGRFATHADLHRAVIDQI